MGFKILSATPSAAVASAGTIAFTLGNAAEWGQVKLEGNHVLYAEGLQAGFNFPADFTVSASGATVTVTYNGTTSIPANTLVKLQLETPGENNYLGAANTDTNVVKDFYGNIRATTARPMRALIGNPAAGSATAILATTAVGDTAVHALTTVYVCDVPRVLTIKSSGADTAVITIRGTDEFGQAVTEAMTLNGTNAVNGKKAFKTVISYQAAAGAPSNNLSIGTLNTFGLPFFLPGGTSAGAGYVLKEAKDGATPSAGTFAGGDLTKATSTTGDIRGTWAPNDTPDGSKVFEVVIMASDLTFKGVPQYAG